MPWGQYVEMRYPFLHQFQEDKLETNGSVSPINIGLDLGRGGPEPLIYGPLPVTMWTKKISNCVLTINLYLSKATMKALQRRHESNETPNIAIVKIFISKHCLDLCLQ